MSEKLSQDMGGGAQTTAQAGRVAAKGAKKGVQSGVKIASELATTGGRIKWAVIAGCVCIGIIACLLTGGLPGTSMNSFTGINPAQDPIEGNDEDGNPDDYVDLSDAQKTEIEGINILGEELMNQKASAEKKVAAAAKKNGVSSEATLQMMNANFVTIGGAETISQHQENGEYTEEEFQASVLLSAYSISVDNLWGFNEDAIFGEADLANIDTSTKEGRAQYIYLRLIMAGYTSQCACGILGNLEKENSAFDPSVGEAGGTKAGRGIAQWTKGGSRWKTLQRFASINKTSWNDLKTQVDTLIYELEGGENTWVTCLKKCHAAGIEDLYCDNHGYSTHSGMTPKKFKKVTNIGLATCIFRDHFERPGKVYSSRVSVRLSCAKKWYSKFKSLGTASLSGGAPVGSSGITNEQARLAACNWARAIAADNSFTYGKSPAANQSGCYFCGTQQKKEKAAKRLRAQGKSGYNHSYAKTYCCNTFVTAAYAHGANDPYVYNKCKSGGCLGFNVGGNCANRCGKGAYKNFKYLGHIPKSQLQPGDVLGCSTHAKIYLGNGQEAQASGGISKNPWGANTIRVKKLSYESKYKVFRYVGTGGSNYYKGGSLGTDGVATEHRTYTSYHEISKITKKDVTKVATITGTGDATCPQSMAYMGDDTYTVAYNSTNGDRVQYLKKFEGSTCVKSKKVSLGHANGLCYNPDTGYLYSVRGKSKKVRIFKGTNLKHVEDDTLPYGTSGIAFDQATNSYYLSSGDNVRTTDSNFKAKTSFKKVGTWKYAQDIGGANGTVYVACSVNKNGNNRISMYNAETGDYYGSYKVGWGEIEDCEVDEDGHLLILINIRGSNTDYIYRTKEALALDSNNSMMYGPGNWRYDLRDKFSTYLAENDYYDMVIETDENGDAVKYEGTISNDTDIESEIDDYEEAAEDDMIDVEVSDGDDNILNDLTDTDKSDEYEEFVKNNTEDSKKDGDKNSDSSTSNKKESSGTDSLNTEKFINVSLKQKDIYAFASAAFGVTKSDITELYGPTAKRDQTLRDMALDQIALLHNVDNVDAALVIEDADSIDYTIGDKLGNYKITTYTDSTPDDKVQMKKMLLLKSYYKTSPRRKALVTCAAPSDIPLGTVIYAKALDMVLVVEDHFKDDSNTIAIYTGSKIKTANDNAAAIKSAMKNKKSSGIYLVLGLTQNEARSLGNSVGKGSEGAVKWGKKICDDQRFVYVNGLGTCHFCNGTTRAYVCTTFVKACYAHGAGDTEMKKWCKSNAYGMVSALHSAMKRSTHWKSMGAIPISKMKPGDVIVFGSQHVEMYYGNGMFMGAHHMCANRDDDISYKSGWTGYTDVMRYLGNK